MAGRGDHEGEGTAFPGLAVKGDGHVHFVHDLLGDGQAKAAALVAAALFSLVEAVKSHALRLLAHADAVILDIESYAALG